MCRTCGCSEVEVSAPHAHEHGDDHHHPVTVHPVTVPLEQRVLERNDRLAAATRERLRARGIVALNVMSGPGAGKTTLLERTLHDLAGQVAMSVIEGDQATDHDAARIRAAGGRAVQINTGAGCHLDAAMVARALDELDPPDGTLVFVENVGNLVCPALFDLGEAARVVLVAVTDGDDKPLKYPHMFRAADLLVLNKVDLLPHVAFDTARCLRGARQMNPAIGALEVSATRGDGLAPWYAWLGQRLLEARQEVGRAS